MMPTICNPNKVKSARVQFEAQRAERFQVLEESWAAFQEEDPETIEREVAQAVAEVRDEIRREQQGDATVE